MLLEIDFLLLARFIERLESSQKLLAIRLLLFSRLLVPLDLLDARRHYLLQIRHYNIANGMLETAHAAEARDIGAVILRFELHPVKCIRPNHHDGSGNRFGWLRERSRRRLQSGMNLCIRSLAHKSEPHRGVKREQNHY